MVAACRHRAPQRLHAPHVAYVVSMGFVNQATLRPSYVRPCEVYRVTQAELRNLLSDPFKLENFVPIPLPGAEYCQHRRLSTDETCSTRTQKSQRAYMHDKSAREPLFVFKGVYVEQTHTAITIVCTAHHGLQSTSPRWSYGGTHARRESFSCIMPGSACSPPCDLRQL